ncbi:(+)-neomenthol dehydrogenase [Linum grandiflorum]
MEAKQLLLEPLLDAPTFPSSARWWSKETTAVVTGGNKGIGFAVAKKLAELGLTVVLTARDVERGNQAVETLRSRYGLDGVHFRHLDVSDPCSIKTFVSQFHQDFGLLDILVNNAAVSFNQINENSVKNAETVIKTNFYGPKLLIETFLPFFRRSSSHSRILNLSSRLGSVNKVRNRNLRAMLESHKTLTEEEIEEKVVRKFLNDVKEGTWEGQGWPALWTDYAVSKLALNAYSKILADRYSDGRLSVNCFCPGFTQTSMTGGKGTHRADDAAEFGVGLALLPPGLLTSGNFYYLGYCNRGVVNSKL